MPEKEICNWYLFRIKYQNEKKVKDLLDIAGIDNYIPFEIHNISWKGETKQVEMPVIPGVGFARVNDLDLGMLTMMQEMSFLLTAEGRYIIIPNDKMVLIQNEPSSFQHLILQR